MTGTCVDNPDAPVGTSCDADGDFCTIDFCDGNGGCVFDMNQPCGPDDGCCAQDCNALNDPNCSPVCGNGVLEPGESCDDGNGNNDDGCTTVCTILTGWECTGSPSICTPPPDTVPTVSEWGLLVLALLLLTAGKIQASRMRQETF